MKSMRWESTGPKSWLALTAILAVGMSAEPAQAFTALQQDVSLRAWALTNSESDSEQNETSELVSVNWGHEVEVGDPNTVRGNPPGYARGYASLYTELGATGLFLDTSLGGEGVWDGTQSDGFDESVAGGGTLLYSLTFSLDRTSEFLLREITDDPDMGLEWSLRFDHPDVRFEYSFAGILCYDPGPYTCDQLSDWIFGRVLPAGQYTLEIERRGYVEDPFTTHNDFLTPIDSTFTLQFVPEPATGGLLAFGLIALVARARQLRKEGHTT
ncbi:MAG: PEP-CTERM sorting domain-containing protein [Proteobacteria bacterium]|nr:PEP-CTERM sorting domain-containing protein [Pseudomonadota bacterium]